jgi:hypothetical protein
MQARRRYVIFVAISNSAIFAVWFWQQEISSFRQEHSKDPVQVAAAMSGDSQAFSLAIQNGIDSTDAQGNTALIAAAFTGNAALALQLIGAKADICKQNDTGCDATWIAAAYGKPDVLKTLLASGGSALSCNKQVSLAVARQRCFPATCLVGACCLSVRHLFGCTGG